MAERTPSAKRPENRPGTPEFDERRWLAMFAFAVDRLTERRIGKIPRQRRKARTHVDVGIHNGFAFRQLSAVADHVVGYDISDKHMAEAKKKAAEVQEETGVKISLLQGDAHTPPIKNGSVQSATVSDVAGSEGAKYPQAIFQGVHDMLAPGGKVVFTMKGKVLQNAVENAIEDHYMLPETREKLLENLRESLENMDTNVDGSGLTLEQIQDLMEATFPGLTWYGQEYGKPSLRKRLQNVVRLGRRGISATADEFTPRKTTKEGAREYNWILAVAKKENPNRTARFKRLRAVWDEVRERSRMVPIGKREGFERQRFKTIRDPEFEAMDLQLVEARFRDNAEPLRRQALFPAIEQLRERGWFKNSLVMELGIGQGNIHKIGPDIKGYVGVDYDNVEIATAKRNISVDPRFAENRVDTHFFHTDTESFAALWRKLDYRSLFAPMRVIVDLPVGPKKEATPEKERKTKAHKGDAFRKKWAPYGLDLLGNTMRLLRSKSSPKRDEAIVVSPGYHPPQMMEQLLGEAGWGVVEEVAKARIPLKKSADMSWMEHGSVEYGANFYNAAGEPISIKTALAMHEEDRKSPHITVQRVFHDAIVLRVKPIPTNQTTPDQSELRPAA